MEVIWIAYKSFRRKRPYVSDEIISEMRMFLEWRRDRRKWLTALALCRGISGKNTWCW
jgi:hypothetical protein